MFKRVFHFNGVILSLFAALWIITGSTVVFHQKYVYHNLLTQWQDMLLKTSAKDTKKYLKFTDRNSTSAALLDFDAVKGQYLAADIFSHSVIKITSAYGCLLPATDCFTSLQYRGPPAA